ncbi:MAG: hypothetical protein IJ252_07260 [Solobacterium sp.]|nr:hypothetical protein [Solobacterium sp.]
MEKEIKRVTLEEAAIMALMMHSRKHMKLHEAVSTALHLRRQYNFLSDHGIDREAFEKLLDDVHNGDITDCWR